MWHTGKSELKGVTQETIMLWFLSVLMFTAVAVGAQNVVGPGALPVGSWFTLQYAYHDQTNGSGKYAGYYKHDARGTVTLTAIGQSGTAISIKRHWAGYVIDYSYTAQGPYWSNYIGGTAPPGSTVATNQGSVATPDKTYTVDLTSMKVTAVNGTATNGGDIGYLLQPAGLTVGSTVTKGWWDTAGDWVAVPCTVTQYQPIMIQGASVNAFTLTYTGQTVGINTGSMNATGPATENYAYDAAYGVFLTNQYSGTYALSDTAGEFTEKESWNWQLVATNISFPTQAATNTASQTGSTASRTPFNLFTPTTLGIVAGALIALVIGAYAVTRRTKPGHHDIERVKRCQVCHSELPADAIFRGECGTRRRA